MAWTFRGPCQREQLVLRTSSTSEQSTGRHQALSKQPALSLLASCLWLSAFSGSASTATRRAGTAGRRTAMSKAFRLAAPIMILVLVALAGARADDEDDVDEVEDPEEIMYDGQQDHQQEERRASVPWTEFNGVKIAILKEGDCKKKAGHGDTVLINHIGAYQREDGQMAQFDGNGPTPMPVTLGEHRIIRGMEKGMYGMCQGEQRSVLIPPELAFDDVSRRMTNKPVPDGTMVMYEITAVKVAKEGEVDIWSFIAKWYQVVIFFGLVGGFVVYYVRKNGRKGKKGKKKGRS